MHAPVSRAAPGETIHHPSGKREMQNMIRRAPTGRRRDIVRSSGAGRRFAIGQALALGLLASLAFPSLAADIDCSGGRERPVTGTIDANVNVPVGAECVIDKAEIQGNVRVYWKGSISIRQTTIHGDFSATGAAVVRFNSPGEHQGDVSGKVIVDGDVVIKESHFVKTSGFGDSTVIGKDLTLKRNHAAEKGVIFVMCPTGWCSRGNPVRVTGDVAIRWNHIPIEINNFHVGGDLNCRDNAGEVVASPNGSPPLYDITFRRATGQCARLVPKS